MNAANSDEIQLSIVIAAWNGNRSLLPCLASLEKQTDKAGLEIIVASNFSVSIGVFTLPAIFKQFDETATVPEIRREGIALATGKIVALVEDHCIFDTNWSREIKKAHESADVAIGGSVENVSVDKALDWAVYFYDYGRYMLPNQLISAEALSGLNVSYKRSALNDVVGFYQNGFFETIINDELMRRGHLLRMWPRAIVYHNKNYELKRALQHCYHLARSYAALRVSNVSMPKRLLFAALSCILPVLLPVRIILTIFKKGRNLAPLLRSLPFIILLMFIWSYGEFCGYLFGEGESSGEWR